MVGSSAEEPAEGDRDSDGEHAAGEERVLSRTVGLLSNYFEPEFSLIAVSTLIMEAIFAFAVTGALLGRRRTASGR